MRKELIFNNGHNNYSINKYYFQKCKKPININKVAIKKIVLSNKTPYGKEGANKYYIGYVGSIGFRPLHIIIKKIKLYTNHMNVLADNKELLKYIEIWDKIVDLFNEKHTKRVLYNNTICNNEYIKTRLTPYNENFHGNKKITKYEYYGYSILLLESICEVENKHYPKTFLDEFFEIHNDNNINKLFKELVQIIDCLMMINLTINKNKYVFLIHSIYARLIE